MTLRRNRRLFHLTVVLRREWGTPYCEVPTTSCVVAEEKNVFTHSICERSSTA